MIKFYSMLAIGLIISIANTATAQSTVLGQDSDRRVITTAVPFLLLSPDARSGAMGDVGVATSPDANAAHWNPAKLAFIQNNWGFSLNYTPWLNKIVNDMSINYLSFYKKLGDEQAFGASLRYFDLGDIQLTDAFGNSLGDFNPREFAFDGTYSRILTEHLSIGSSARFILSNLAGSITTNNNDARAGISVAADIGLYYTRPIITGGNNSNLSFGANISNIGSKITYNSASDRDFIPTNLRLGSAYTTSLDPYNTLTFALDFNKLLVPTTPVYERNPNGTIVRDADGNPRIERGRDPNRSLLSGMFGSFSDAPDGFSEELREIMIAFGTEYWYNNIFAARAGYFYENQYKGNRKYFTVGLGVRYQVFGLDFAYLVPQRQNNPLAETLRFSLTFNFED
ncbi:type IX secretion system outer membrane channel protein PorV [soil metagenome]